MRTFKDTALPSTSPTYKDPAFPSHSPTYEDSAFQSVSPTLSCNISSYQRKVDIFQQLTVLSGIESFDDSQHPVSIASSWITDEDPLQVCPGDVNLAQRYTLVLLYFYTSGDDWLTCTRDGTTPCQDERFLSSGHECTWGGVTCDSLNRVIKLNLGKSLIYNLLSIICVFRLSCLGSFANNNHSSFSCFR